MKVAEINAGFDPKRDQTVEDKHLVLLPAINVVVQLAEALALAID